jgi:hypothetical protein
MNTNLESLAQALESTSASILNSTGEERRATEITNVWHVAPLTRRQLADIPKRLADLIRESGIDEIEVSDQSLVINVTEAIAHLNNQIVPNLMNSNAHASVPAFLDTLSYAQLSIIPLLRWQKIDPRSDAPPALRRRLESVRVQIEGIVPDTNALKDRIKLLSDANEAAVSFPLALADIEKSKLDVDNIKKKIENLDGFISDSINKSNNYLIEFDNMQKEAIAIVKKTKEAHRATTSTGLAAAFEDRAGVLTNSARIWVASLITSLGSILLIGLYNVNGIKEYQKQLLNSEIKPEIFWTQLIASLLIAAAPLWLAWVSTKQINQKYKSAEDYAYKSSISRSYEGYRSEAERLRDPEMEKRLLNVTLDKFEESPLRLLDQKNHGSPIHELLSLSDRMSALTEKWQKTNKAIVDGVKKATDAIKPGEKSD